MGYEDGGNGCFFLNTANFLAGLEPESGVQIGEGLVQKKDTGKLDKGPGYGDALLLSARKLGRFPVQKLGDLYKTGGFLHPGVHLLFCQPVRAF